MYFEAKANDKNYEVTVSEKRKYWQVSLKEEHGDWVHHEVLKNDYQGLDQHISFLFKNTSYLIDHTVESGTNYNIYCRGSYRMVEIVNDEILLHESLKAGGSTGSSDCLISGMPGKIFKLMVKEGDIVDKDTPLLIIEAMKMENEIRSTTYHKVKKIHIKEGDKIESGATLITFEEIEKKES